MHRLAGDELVEPARAPVRHALFVDEGEVVLVERAEPVVPVDVLERALAAPPRKVDAQDAEVAAFAGASHVRGRAAARFDPGADFLVIGRRARGAGDVDVPRVAPRSLLDRKSVV